MVRWVRLNNNQLTTLDEDTFSGMDNLRAAMLGSNSLETIPPRLFTGHTKLHTISLDNNEMTSVPGGAFDGLVNIRHLLPTWMLAWLRAPTLALSLFPTRGFRPAF